MAKSIHGKNNLTIFVKLKKTLTNTQRSMKKNIFLLSSVLTMSLLASAQTEVTVGVTQGKDYGVTYMLPQTEIEIKVHTTKHTYTPGEFCRYADRYLRLSGVSDEPEVGRDCANPNARRPCPLVLRRLQDASDGVLRCERVELS